ncbi:hypothetical protein B0H21DRAFT_697437, partial [Amylocystis lapponica]
KLQLRIRKQGELPEGSEFRQAKYDTAFREPHMSDDETVLDADGNFPGRYVSRAPAWRSAKLTELYNTVDTVKDPNPSKKYIPRVKAPETVDVPPKIAKDIKNRARRWMINPEWLAKPENKDYDVETRIVDSGVAWGDAEDPEDKVERHKRFREEKGIDRENKRARKAPVSKPKKNKPGKGKSKGNPKKKQPVGDSESGLNTLASASVAGPSNATRAKDAAADGFESSDGLDYI